MWLPFLLQQLNESEMQALGMKMSAEDIYSVNKSSLKDAIVKFGGGCTGEVISPEGLLLTNHHCGFGQIQSHSTLENNYVEDGFWAMSREEEIPNPGLTVTFVVRMEDVTGKVMGRMPDNVDPEEKQKLIDERIQQVEEMAEIEAHEKAEVRAFFKGNQYILIVTTTYRDVRLVGAPPSSIGKFGADTDNWVWPRHTGDFSLFRIYAGPDNLPADYSEDNVPYQPKHFLPISLGGVKEGDFTLVFGFPGRTNEYLPSSAVRQVIDITDPTRIAIRDKSLAILDQEMRNDPEVKIKYVSKFAGIANGWKKWIGEVQGLKSANAIAKKEHYESQFMEVLASNKALHTRYGNLLGDFKQLYKQREPYQLADIYHYEVTSLNVELLRIAKFMNRLESAYEEAGEAGYSGFQKRLAGYLDRFYKDYEPAVDQKVFAALVEMFVKNVDSQYVPREVMDMAKAAQGDYTKLAEDIYRQTILTNKENVDALWEMSPEDAIQKLNQDPAFQMAKAFVSTYEETIESELDAINEELEALMSTYMRAQMEVFPKNRFFPDANSTMRVSYGKVEGYKPQDGVKYDHQTYLSGVMEKYKPGDYEFDVPEKLRQLYERKDYGKYGENGKMPVCFIGSNHTTGGNSGSPAIDAEGRLIGLNFDRVWEGTMSDIYYDPSICRNIMVDIRYVLFIIDKYAGAGHLIEEMRIIE